MAIWRRGTPDALLHHFDQGASTPASSSSNNGVVCLMCRSRNAWDNAAMKSFFSFLKTKRVCRQVYRSRRAERADVSDYIERSDYIEQFYNMVQPCR